MVTARAPGEALAGVPAPRTLLAKVNSHLICVLCRGYYIDATTIVECLHTFCRSCIVKHLRVKSYCPVCEVMINSARPNIKLDKALQDIVYKLVPGLFQREMCRRRAFYRERPELAAGVTPEQRGEDTERVVFSPDDVISFSLEYAGPAPPPPPSEASSSSSSSEGPDDEAAVSRRFLRCPAVVNISHLKKFLSLKFDIDAAHFFVDILYKRVPLPDYYTLMDVAYIYNWKRIEPMRFFYQITDFTAARDRFGFVVMTGGGRSGKRSPAEGDAPDSPAQPREDPTEGDSTGSRTPPLGDGLASNKSRDGFSESEEREQVGDDSFNSTRNKRSLPDVEKSQFLNSFELTPKCSPSKNPASPAEEEKRSSDTMKLISERTPESVMVARQQSGPVKRKSLGVENVQEQKKQKLSPEKCKINPEEKSHPKTTPSNSSVLENLLTQATSANSSSSERKAVVGGSMQMDKSQKTVSNEPLSLSKQNLGLQQQQSEKQKKINNPTDSRIKPIAEPQKKCKNPILKTFPVKRKLSNDGTDPQIRPVQQLPRIKIVEPEISKEHRSAMIKNEQKQISNVPGELKNPPLKMSISLPKQNAPNSNVKFDNIKKQSETEKLMAIKPKKGEGENPLRSLFNSCNINIPSSLSITLTDQKLEQKQEEVAEESASSETKKRIQPASNPPVAEQTQPTTPQPSTPGDKNCLEIIKLSETENQKAETTQVPKSLPITKPPETVTSGKGRDVPNLKPISEAKIVPFSKPQTFQQTFLASLQQQNDKPKYTKSRSVHPKVGTPTGIGGKPDDVSDNIPKTLNVPKTQSGPSLVPIQKLAAFTKNVKSDSALDLSTPHTVQSQFGPQQAKALETMQSIDILAKRQQHSQRMMSPQNFSQDMFKMRASGSGTLRIPVPPSNNGQSKTNLSLHESTRSPKHFPEYFQPLKQANIKSPNEPGQMPAMKPISQQLTSSPSPQTLDRIQTRSPSSSPKLVIACPSPKSQSPEQKQFISPRIQESTGQSNLISSSQISSSNAAASSSESMHSKDVPKMMKSVKTVPAPKQNNVRQPNPNSNNSHKPNKSSGDGSPGSDMFQGLLAQQNYIRQQLELQTRLGFLPPGAARQWFNNPIARAQIDNFVKNMTQNSSPFGNNHNSKEK